MSKVLFFNIAAHGHTYPTLPLVAELVRRGEQVIYYSTGSAFQQVIEGAGATFRNSATPFLNEETQIDESMIKVAYMLLQNAQASLVALLPQVKEEKPDYIIHDGLSPWGRYIAQIMGVPSICSMTTFAIPPFTMQNVRRVFRTPGNGRLLFSNPAGDMMRMALGGMAELARFRALGRALHKTYGIAKPHLIDMFSNCAPLNIVYTTRQFQPFAELLDESFKFVGPSIVTRPDPVSFPFDALDNAPVIYISLGTVFNEKAGFYRTCFEAFGSSNQQVVMSVGKRTDIASLGTIPRNFIVKDFVPQLELLPRTALFITHGGMNSVSEALYYGVPLMVIPQSADQNLVGQRIAQLGAGRTLRRTRLTAPKLRSIAEAILTQPAYQQASARLGKSFGAAQGYLRAADEILAFKRLMNIND